MNQAWVSGEDRRRFFRIDDVVGLHYCLVEEQHTLAGRIEQQNVLQGLDVEIATLLVQVRREQPLVADTLALLNRKLQYIARQPDTATISGVAESALEYHTTAVNISASGVAFSTDHPYSAGSRFRLDMLLRPGDWQLPVVARVVACDAVIAGWYLRLDYEEISQSDQDMLVRHMLVRQSQQIRR
jgi:hypothetical protein